MSDQTQAPEPASETPSGRKRVLPPAYLGTTILVMLTLHYLLPVAHWIEWPWRNLGVVLMVMGLTVAGVGRLQFKRSDTTVKPFQESSALVTGGVFSFTRNPMYLGMVFLLTGLAILMGSLTPFLVIPIFAWLIHHRFILREERHLTDQFGQKYIDYTLRVRRWL